MCQDTVFHSNKCKNICVFNRFPDVRRIHCQLYLCMCPLSRGSRQHSFDTDQHQVRCSQNRLYHRLWGRRETSTLLLPLFFWALSRDQRRTTFAGVGAVCVQTVLIFLTGRGVSGALIYIWNMSRRFNSTDHLCKKSKFVLCSHYSNTNSPTQASSSSSFQPSSHSLQSWLVAPVHVLQDLWHSARTLDLKRLRIDSFCRQNVTVTCAEREGVVPGFVEVADDAVQAEVACVTVVTAALSVTSPSAVAIAHPVSMTGPFGASHAS